MRPVLSDSTFNSYTVVVVCQSVLAKVRGNYKQLSERELDVTVDKNKWLKADLYVHALLSVTVNRAVFDGGSGEFGGRL